VGRFALELKGLLKQAIARGSLFRPFGACFSPSLHPRLTPWALFLLRFAAESSARPSAGGLLEVREFAEDLKALFDFFPGQ
jgi:hypothetical protein